MDNWSNYTYEFEGGWYELGSERFIACFENPEHEERFKLWLNFLIGDGDTVTFNTMYDMAQFIQNERGTYRDFAGSLSIDNVYGL